MARSTLDPKLDIVFWLLFAADRNRSLLIALLNDILRPHVPIASVTVLSPKPDVASVDGKQIVLDLRVRLASDELIDVEMQARPHDALRERILYYWATLYYDQIQRGDDYTELRPCVVILIADFIELAGNRFHSVFQVRSRHDQALLTDHLQLHFLELPKLPHAIDKNDEPSLVGWCRFLTATADADLEALAMESPILKQAKEALEALSADRDARMMAEHREMVLRTQRMVEAATRRIAHEKGLAEGEARGRAEGEARGRAEGEARGRAEGKAEVLLRQVTIKFGQPSEHVARRVANATEADLNRWAERLMTATSLDGVFAD